MGGPREEIANIHIDYTGFSLSRNQLHPNPFHQFEQWFQEARLANLAIEPNAMTLATATKEGLPSARMILLKGFDEMGFVFFTNYESQKGQELAENPQATLLFYWGELHRQVRLSGSVGRISSAESADYFYSRPVGSQLGSLASQQSRVLGSRAELEKRLADLEEKYRDQPVPWPSHWGGFRLVPHLFEFWQGRVNRLHDRFRYTRQPDESWLIERLSP